MILSLLKSKRPLILIALNGTLQEVQLRYLAPQQHHLSWHSAFTAWWHLVILLVILLSCATVKCTTFFFSKSVLEQALVESVRRTVNWQHAKSQLSAWLTTFPDWKKKSVHFEWVWKQKRQWLTLGRHVQLISFNCIILSVWSNDPVVQDQPLHSSAFTLRGAITAKRLLQLVSTTCIIKARYGEKNKQGHLWCQTQS